MTHSQKLQNDRFFKQVSLMAKNYHWPEFNEFFTIEAGKFRASTPRGKKLIMEVTSPLFHQTCLH